MTRILRGVAVALCAAACGSSGPGEDSLRASFAAQLAANRFVQDFKQDGDAMTFRAPGPEGGTASWRVQIDAAAIEPNDDEALPYKGTIDSSWYADGQKIEPRGSESNLPFELLSNGLSQHAWAFWEAGANRWGWE
jgi:hypothetical protein